MIKIELTDINSEVFETMYFTALDQDWKTLEGHSERDRWQFNLEKWRKDGVEVLFALLEENSMPVGYTAINGTNLMHVWVNSSYRNSSIGSRLIKDAIKHIREINEITETITCRVYPQNYSFFERLSFQPYQKGAEDGYRLYRYEEGETSKE
jgi:ribosomal protein S18 acetylase RimI-like enzyme